MHDLKVWPGVEADGGKPTSTPGKSTTGEDQMSRLAKVLNDGESIINVTQCLPYMWYETGCRDVTIQ